jgi:small-conductance mechanosensitive channel
MMPGRFKLSVLILLILLSPAGASMAEAQLAPAEAGAETPAEEEWTAPDLLNLPSDWLTQLEAIEFDEETIQLRFDRFAESANQRIQGLDGQNLVEAEAALVGLGNKVTSLLAAIQEAPEAKPQAIPNQDSYTLDQYLSLRALWRETNSGLESRQNEFDQEQQRYRVVREKYDTLVQEYKRTDPRTPSRVISGLNRMASAIELLAIGKTNARDKARLSQREARLDELENRIAYARGHLVPGNVDSEDYDSAIDRSNEALAKIHDTRSMLQNQLLETVSEADQGSFFIQLSLNQQLTLASASESLLQVHKALDREKKKWYLLNHGEEDSAAEIDKANSKNAELVKQARLQSEVWTSASRTTLITPSPPLDEEVHAKHFTDALDAARESLDIIRQIEDAIDDLGQVQNLVSAEFVSRGLGGFSARLRLLGGTAWDSIQAAIGFKLFYIGKVPVTPGSLLKVVLIVVFGFTLSWLIRRMLSRIQRRRNLSLQSSSIYTLGRVLHYLIVTVTVLVAFTALGLDISSLALIAGALSVGIGFGLQSIVNNFLSGLILLFEGSLRIGDFIELDSGVTGVVKEIRTRYTRINTNDNVDIVVPNSELVSFKLTNWTLREPIVRIHVPFGVAYDSDREQVRKAALEAADEVPFTMKSMPARKPDVLLVDFGDSSLNYKLRVWVASDGVRRPLQVRAAYYEALAAKFGKYGITVPFPQRDLHMRGTDPESAS